MMTRRTVQIKFSRHYFLLIALLIAAVVPCATVDGQNQRKKTITRVFWQDLESGKLAYADLATTDKWHINRGWVQGFPESESQQLGPMEQISKTVVVSINSDETTGKGKIVGIDSGVIQQPHGNHFHWIYSSLPQARSVQPFDGAARNAMAINNQYYFGLSDQRFVAADPNQLMQGNTNSLRTLTAGGEKGCIAVSNNGVGYATWNDTEGDHAGQVDVVNLYNPNAPASSFRIGSGGISAVTVNSGKAFFLHDKGLSWTNVNQQFSANGANQNTPADNPVANSEPGSELSGLINERNWVLYTANGEQPALCMCNAASSQPAVIKLPIPVEQGLRLSAPKTKLSLGKRFAFAFLEREDPGSEVKEQLVVVELDPNRDFDFSDARIAKQIPIDSSKIDGDRGHHQICFDAFGRFAVFTNPGDGLLSVMTLNDLVVRVRFRVGGVPDRIVAVGAPEHFH